MISEDILYLTEDVIHHIENVRHKISYGYTSIELKEDKFNEVKVKFKLHFSDDINKPYFDNKLTNIELEIDLQYHEDNSWTSMQWYIVNNERYDQLEFRKYIENMYELINTKNKISRIYGNDRYS